MKSVYEAVQPFIKWVLLALAALLLLAVLVRLLGIQPPNEFTLATGRPNGAYYAFAEQYQQRFAEEGYQLNIVETAGSLETIDLLNRGEVDAGFVQSAIGSTAVNPDLSTLASIYYEALWVFYRSDLGFQPTSLHDLEGLSIDVGEEGSGTHLITTFILGENGLTSDNTLLLGMDTDTAIAQLKAGDLDVIMLIAGAAAQSVQELAATPGVSLLSMTDAEAYTRRYKNVTAVTLPAGTFDLARGIPPEDVTLISGTATLVASPELHPDLARLLLVIAGEVHDDGGLLEAQGEFPSARLAGIPPQSRRAALSGKRPHRAGALLTLVASLAAGTPALPAAADRHPGLSHPAHCAANGYLHQPVSHQTALPAPAQD